jgi:branched-chain amino acid transport system substrate-binding protein
MPYGATKFVDGQNTGAQPLMTQVLKGDIKVIVPRDYREAEPVFPAEGLSPPPCGPLSLSGRGLG